MTAVSLLLALLALAPAAAPATATTDPLAAELSLQPPGEDRHGVAEALARLYAARDLAPAWFERGHPTRQALAVIEVLLDARSRGLDPARYDAAALAEEVAVQALDPVPPSEERLARLDVALSRAVLGYAGDVRLGRVDPRALGLDWPAPAPLDLAAVGEQLATTPDPAAELDALEPRWPGYRALRDALPGHPEAAQRIALALERWRWLPPEPPGRMVLVDVPGFQLEAYEAGALDPVLSMPVVVGRSDDPLRRTPVLARPVANVVLAPYWEVPRRLATVDLLPRFEADPGFGARLGYFMEGPEGVEPVSPASLERWKTGRLRLRQAPGPLNALGHALLLFPNDQDVYLHDSPDRRLFARSRRAFSSGCVRVGDAAGLSAWVLRGTPGWDEARVAAALSGRVTTWVQPARRPWVYLTYATASVGADGALVLHEDLYGEDARLERALRQPAPAAAAVARYQARGGPESRWTKSSSG